MEDEQKKVREQADTSNFKGYFKERKEMIDNNAQ